MPVAPELLLALARDSAVPLHAQLEAQLRAAVRAGRLGPGARLPSTRALAAELSVSRGVVVEAYAQLAAEGWLAVRRGRAPAVAAAPARPAPNAAPFVPPAPRFDLRPGVPDGAAFPRAAWAGAVRRAAATATDADLGYPDSAGHPRLRAALAAALGRTRGVLAAPEHVVVCAGVAQALGLLARVLVAGGARTLAVEDPSHRETRALLAHHGLAPIPVPVDARGLDPAGLDGADAVLVTPAHQFPTGVVLAPERRAALLAWARRADAVVIEDDYDAEYRYDRQPVGALQALAPERVVHISSVSKTLAPALRLGWAVAPPPLAAALAAERRLADHGAPTLDQLALADLIERGDLLRHVRRTRARYRERRDALLAALPGLRVTGIAAGIHVAVGLPEGTEEEAIRAAAAERSVAVATLGEHVIVRPREPALLLGYARHPAPTLAAAARELRAVLR